MKFPEEEVGDIRQRLGVMLSDQDFVTDKTGVKTIELIGVSFIANEPQIFGTVNEDYVRREIEWYASQSLNVYDIPPPVPAIWKQVADKDGQINSNYGWCIYSRNNGSQYANVLEELQVNPNSRRAVAIYTRPSMWLDYDKNGRSDFMCTNAVQYLIREDRLHAVVQMRSNDVTYGFKNDRAWQLYVLEKLAKDLNVEVGNLVWNAGSLHVYERDFYLVDYYWNYGEITVTKEEYRRQVDSEWAK